MTKKNPTNNHVRLNNDFSQYKQKNIFSRIIKGEISSDILYEVDKILAFKDLNPIAPVHILVIPKGNYIDAADFAAKALAEDISYYYKMIDKIAIENGATDYRLISNKGEGAGQTVFHFHTHIISGIDLTKLI
jgi:diadenosine tetraphosphate (Ap4A) HIT family hydrolase